MATSLATLVADDPDLTVGSCDTSGVVFLARVAVLVVSASITPRVETVSAVFITSALAVVAVGATGSVARTAGVRCWLVVVGEWVELAAGEVILVGCLCGTPGVFFGIEATLLAELAMAEVNLVFFFLDSPGECRLLVWPLSTTCLAELAMGKLTLVFRLLVTPGVGFGLFLSTKATCLAEIGLGLFENNSVPFRGWPWGVCE